MYAGLRSDRLAHLSFLQSFERLLELRQNLARFDLAEVPALSCRRVFRGLLGDRGEFFSILDNPLAEIEGPLGHRSDQLVGRSRIQPQDDVSQMDSSRHEVIFLVRLVAASDVFRSDVHTTADLPVQELNFFDFALHLVPVLVESHPLLLECRLELIVGHAVLRSDPLDVTVDVLVAHVDILRGDLFGNELFRDQGLQRLLLRRRGERCEIGFLLGDVLVELVQRDRLTVDAGDDPVEDLRSRDGGRSHPKNNDKKPDLHAWTSTMPGIEELSGRVHQYGRLGWPICLRRARGGSLAESLEPRCWSVLHLAHEGRSTA